MVQYVKSGRLGRKSGRGVYEYPGQEPGRASGAGEKEKAEQVLMEVVRAHVGVGDVDRIGRIGFAHRHNPLHAHGNHAFLILQLALKQQKLLRPGSASGFAPEHRER